MGLLGTAHSHLGEYAAAESAYKMAVTLEPQSKKWRLGLLRCLVETQRLGDALVLSDQLIKLQPDDPQVLLVKGQVLLSLGRHEEGRAVLALAEQLAEEQRRAAEKAKANTGATRITISARGDVLYRGHADRRRGRRPRSCAAWRRRHRSASISSWTRGPRPAFWCK